MNNPAISIVLSVYNAEKYIGEAIASILSQTFSDFEFILIDDGSTDNTLGIIKSFSDPRIRVIKNEKNLGMAKSWNIGLIEASGEFVARMDGDDIAHKERLQKQHDFFAKHPDIDVCGTFARTFGAEERILEYRTSDEEIKAGLVWKPTLLHPSVMLRMKKIREYKLLYDELLSPAEDWLFWLKIKPYVRFEILPDVLLFYRMGQQNITYKLKHEGKERNSNIHRMILSGMKIQFDDYELKLHQFILAQFSLIPNSENVKSARQWLVKLIHHNKNVKLYNDTAFVKIAQENWNRLFYFLVPYGLSTVSAYVTVSGITFSQFSYAVKYYFNRLIGRK